MGAKKEECKCATVTARTWLIIFNSFFLILGLAVAVAGGVLVFGQDLVGGYLEDLLEQVPYDGKSISKILETIGIVMMLLGILLMAFGIVGCLGGCCLVRCCLMIYSMVMIKLLVLEVILIIVCFVMKSMIEDIVKGALQTAMDTFYAGYSGVDPISLGYNFLFNKLACCGINNYTDLYTASNWNRTYSTGGSSYTLVTPFMCCDLSGTFPNVAIPSSVDCAVTPNITTNHYDKGCYDAFFDYVAAYPITMIIIVVCLVLCEIFTFVSAIVLKKEAAARQSRVNDVPRTSVNKARLKKEQLNKNNMGL